MLDNEITTVPQEVKKIKDQLSTANINKKDILDYEVSRINKKSNKIFNNLVTDNDKNYSMPDFSRPEKV